MLKLKLQYFGHLMQRADSLEKTLMLGKIEGKRRRGQQKMRWLDGITDLMDMSLSKIWELILYLEALRVAVHCVDDANHLILCHPFFLLPSIFANIRVFSSESALCTR